jgi:hypothetical protein
MVKLGAHFSGPAYDPAHDHKRLTKQIGRIYDCMKDSSWRTLEEIKKATGDPHASISAQLRHLRKPRFGGYKVDKRHRGSKSVGLYEYRLLPPIGPVLVKEKRRRIPRDISKLITTIKNEPVIGERYHGVCMVCQLETDLRGIKDSSGICNECSFKACSVLLRGLKKGGAV